MFERLKHSFRDLIVLIKRPEMAILPGHLAFYMVLSIVPMFLILIILASSFSVSSEVIANFLGNSVPSEVNEILSSVILRAKTDFNVQFFFLLSIYVASSGLYSVIVSANTLYHNDMKNFWIRKLKSLFLTILFVFLFLFIIIIMAFGNSIIQYFENVVNNDLIWNYINYVYFIARWPFAFIYIYI